MKSPIRISMFLLCLAFFISVHVKMTAAETSSAECRQYTDDIRAILPNAVTFGTMTDRKVQLLDANKQVVGYLLLPPAGKRERVAGYNGVVNVAVVVSPDNKILGVALGENNETPRFLDRLRNAGFLKRWNGKKTSEAAKLKVDAVTRATYSSNAVKSEVDTILRMQK